MGNRAVISFSIIVFACFSFGLVSCRGNTEAPSKQSGQTRESAVSSANTAPNFVLKDLDGKLVSLSDFKGKVVIIDFWATWCPPCLMEIPHFQSLYEEYSDRGLIVIGISLDQGGVNVVKPFVKSKGMTYPVVMGGRQVANDYGGIRGIPTTFVVDRKGDIVEKAVGYRDKAFFEKAVKELL
jgi:cytochrome c biogenesis protein CcmG/thiol:disulfide interchange protein DsbE